MKIGVMAESFRLPFVDAVKKAAELGADGLQIYAVRGWLKYDEMTKEKVRETLDIVHSHGLEISALCGDFGGGFKNPEGRTKPWGTGHAVLACKGIVDTPALVINADDYYGKDAYVKMHDYIVNHMDTEKTDVLDIAMPGFILGNTLSDNGAVTRGICTVDDNGAFSIQRTNVKPQCRQDT